MFRIPLRPIFLLALPVLVLVAIVAGCSNDSPVDPQSDGRSAAFSDDADAIFQDSQSGDTPPSGLVDLPFGAESLSIWPYTGNSFDGTAIDPINLAFIGKAGPLQIREALMSLDGDRSAYGIPPIPPFNAEWTDIVGGGVQTTYSEGEMGWAGSVIQLTLGEFGPLRFHLRLFSTSESFGEDGVWTLGAAHFEIQVPDTTEHQVLSWELAEQIVIVDMMRCGLLDPNLPMMPSGIINATPSWRGIPDYVYNGLPDALLDLIGFGDGPPKPVSGEVPLPNDGQAMIFQLADALPISPGTWTQNVHVDFNQLVPRPFCSTGPGDFLQITGPVDFVSHVMVDADGRYTIESDFTGQLVGMPLDLSTGEPIPAGEPVVARVDGKQRGFMDAFGERITSRDKRIALGADGPEMVITQLKVPSNGKKSYQLLLRCFD